MPTNTQTQLPHCLTIGHSTHSAEELIALLQANQVNMLVDVRTMPRSRHNPQFNRDALPATLAAAGIDYRHCQALGGLRKPRPDSPNDGWRNTSFRGYADYMQTAEFEAAFEQLVALADDYRIALMCAEAVPWRCHRSLIADVLAARGASVAHIIGNKTQPHRLTSFAVLEGKRVTYPFSLQG
ncbi:MAG TPA: DUF488 domain-containing protein [Salinisphaeraceae bacterium]|nr:DUF488 domain-containing protein [Salinisphaeraceae bacterium]